MKKRILLIDGNSMLFRAYYATAYSGARMTTKNGVATNAVFAFVNMLKKAIVKIEPTHVMVAWDAGKPTFRHEQFEAYKGTRKELDPELKVQFPIAREFLDAAGIYRYEEEGIEADDILGSLSKKFKNDDCFILTSDNDLLQLIDDSTNVILMKKGISDLVLMNEESLLDIKKVKPKQIIDLKGLMGDASDNIPGVKGVGEKTAIKLLDQYETLEGVYENIENIKGKLKEKLVIDKENAFMSKMLATIKTDCLIPCSLEDLVYNENNQNELNEFYRKYEMTSFIENDNEAKKKKNYKLEVVDRIDSSFFNQTIGVYFDVDNELYYNQELFGVALFSNEKIYYLNKENMGDLFEKFIKNSNVTKYTFGAKEAYHVLNRYGYEFEEFKYDLKIISFLIDNETNSLEKLANLYNLNFDLSKEDVYGKIGKPKLIDDDQRLKYIENCCNVLMHTHNSLIEKLKELNLVDLMNNIEMPLSYILYEMERDGITVSKEILNEISSKTQEKISELEEEIYELAGEKFNINSPKQLAEILFDKLGLKANKKRSTAIDVLDKLYNEHPIIPLLIEYRKYQKINSTYAIGLQKHILNDGKIHTLYHQCLTQTGRLSSSDPNLQNLSAKDEEAKEIRKAFVASKNHILYAADYSQIELRVLAHMSNETNMISAFNSGVDIHTKTAMELFGCEKEEVTSLMRRQAKTVNFGIVYGQTVYGLATELHISQNEAKEFMDKYFNSYPNIKKYMDLVIENCKENGYVETLFNRRRYISEINDKNYMIREFGKRAAMNAPIQGTAADIIKLAMIKIKKAMCENKVKSKMIMQIHDELVFDVLIEEKEIMEKIIQDGMVNAYKLSVPLIADGKFAMDYYGSK